MALEAEEAMLDGLAVKARFDIIPKAAAVLCSFGAESCMSHFIRVAGDGSVIIGCWVTSSQAGIHLKQIHANNIFPASGKIMYLQIRVAINNNDDDITMDGGFTVTTQTPVGLSLFYHFTAGIYRLIFHHCVKTDLAHFSVALHSYNLLYSLGKK